MTRTATTTATTRVVKRSTRLIDDAYAETDLDAAADKWAAVDAKLGEDVAYIPLEISIFNFLHGGKVTGYSNNVSVNGYADLAVIGVEK
ncbi:hypothetical protein [Nocardioides convexus]|uniref:hypothetical protein n=1 Tax=Nocardioides convexus TaxID=2712224 RepID=UPI0024183D2C|nr:hypothetical protein [Nocardioides convexus]